MSLRIDRGFKHIELAQAGWLLVMFVVGVIASSILQFLLVDVSSGQELSEYRETGYQFISPLLECEHFVNQKDASLKDMNQKVRTLARQYEDQHISVYYRDLITGAWYGYQESEPFSPQSLLKIPVVIALLKIEEAQPGTLQKKVTYSTSIESNLPEDQSLRLGDSYTLQELLERTLILSDNVAFNLLVEVIPTEFLKKVHTDLNLAFPSETTPDDFITVHSYSTIFRVLYNSSYLSRANSEYLLRVLADSTFEQGLRAGLPQEMVVAHKFGIKQAAAGAQSQLHDCGVIYYDERPYILCVMTRGNNITEQQQAIQHISREIFSVL